MGSPQKVKDPRNDAASTLSGFIQAALGNAPEGMANFSPGQLGSIIQNMFQMPAYQGQLGTGVTDQQANIADTLNNQFFRDTQADNLARLNQPSAQLMQNSLLSNMPAELMQNRLGDVAGQSILQAQSLGNTFPQEQMRALSMLPPEFFGQAANMLTGGNQQAINGLMQNAGASNPAIAQLLGAQQQIGGAQGNLQSLFSNAGIQNLLNGGGIDLNKVAAPLEQARQQALAADQRDIKEQFTTAGLRNSSNLADAMSKQALQSETGLQAQLSQLVPQIMGQQQQGQLGALNALAGIGGTQGQLGTALGQLGLQNRAQQGNILNQLLDSQFNAASQLGNQSMQGNQILASLMQSGQQNALQSLLGAGQLNLQNAQLPYQLGNLAAQQTNINQQTAQQANLLQYQDFLRQQQLFPQLLSFLGGTTPTQLGPSAFQQALGGLGTAAAFASMFMGG